MLPERYVRLITAYVDGELTSPHRKLARRLLRRSRRARALYEQLRGNAQRLQALPKKTLGPEFAPQVLSAVADLGTPAASAVTAPVPAATLPPRRPWLTGDLIAIATAAAILLAVAVSAYVLFEPENKTQQQLQVKAEEDKLLPAEQPEPLVLPGTRIALNDPLLEKEVKGVNAIHLEVAVQHKGHALAQLQDTFKENGIRIVVDPAADLTEGDFVVYAENLQPEELVDILRNQRQFDAVFLNPFTDADRRTIAARLGVSADAFKAPRPASIELKKMIPKTGATVPGTPSTPTERYAVVLAAGTPAAHGMTPELRHFLEARRPQPGTIQVVLVLHESRA